MSFQDTPNFLQSELDALNNQFNAEISAITEDANAWFSELTLKTVSLFTLGEVESTFLFAAFQGFPDLYQDRLISARDNFGDALGASMAPAATLEDLQNAWGGIYSAGTAYFKLLAEMVNRANIAIEDKKAEMSDMEMKIAQSLDRLGTAIVDAKDSMYAWSQEVVADYNRAAGYGQAEGAGDYVKGNQEEIIKGILDDPALAAFINEVNQRVAGTAKRSAQKGVMPLLIGAGLVAALFMAKKR